MKKKAQILHRSAAVLTAISLTAAAIPAFAVTSQEYNTWTGYVLRDAAGRYLSVNGGVDDEGISVGYYEADGVAPYNTWYFTQTDYGITLKSALSEGEYYLAEKSGEDGGLELALSKTAGTFVLEEDGTLSAFRSGLDNPVYGQVTVEAVTNVQSGDWNGDGKVNGMDLALLRQAVQNGSADFVQKAVGDVNGDSKLDAADAAQMQDYLLGRETASFAAVKIPSCTILPYSDPAPLETTEPVQTTEPESTAASAETAATTAVQTETTATVTTTATAAAQLDMSDFPEEYTYAANWIWENRMETEQSTARWNTIFDQIVAGDGTLNFVVRWQSYKTLTLEQRQQFETLASDCINDWNDWLKGWDGWKYDHIDVNIVGWAVLDASVLEDLQPDEVVYDSLISDYDSSADTSNGVDTIPDKLPSAPDELSRFVHFADTDYVYPGVRFDMYLWATQGFPDIGGCGGDWGQRLSDTAYLNMLDGTGLHVLEHEIGHGFGLPDFYGGEGESNGFPPGGFPADIGETRDENDTCGKSLMMAGSAYAITDFDGWMLRYTWSKIKEEDGRF